MPGALRGVVPVLLAALAAGATPAPSNPTPCVLDLLGEDASGNKVLQTPAYVLDRPGLVLTSLTEVARHRTRWERLLVAPDSSLPGPAPASGPIPVTAVALADPSRDLLVLRVSGLEACIATVTSGTGSSAADRTDVSLPAVGEVVTGLRSRDGYRSRIFRGEVDRLAGAGERLELLRIRMPDAGGAGAGFLFDRGHELIGSILPSFAGADTRLACAIAISSDRAAAAASESTGETLDSLRQRTPEEFAQTSTGLFSQALLLTRDDQTVQALRLLDEVERLAGESGSLLMERGALRFKAGRLDGAIEDFARAARIDAGRHLAHYNLGLALGAAGRYEAAIEAFELARDIDPRHALTRYQLALALEAAHRPELARQECDHLGGLDATLAGDLKSILSD
jgi:tetratricopeptide repeat protein